MKSNPYSIDCLFSRWRYLASHVQSKPMHPAILPISMKPHHYSTVSLWCLFVARELWIPALQTGQGDQWPAAGPTHAKGSIDTKGIRRKRAQARRGQDDERRRKRQMNLSILPGKSTARRVPAESRTALLLQSFHLARCMQRKEERRPTHRPASASLSLPPCSIDISKDEQWPMCQGVRERGVRCDAMRCAVGTEY